MPLTPIKTPPPTSTRIALDSVDKKFTELDPEVLPVDDVEECHTPRSTSNPPTPPPVCPPAPVKPRPPRRKLAPASGCFYKVPDQNLSSMFIPSKFCNKKLRTC
ncbi:hypothetical protein SAY87_008685 [Trapa incisa]|uniref:Uncharacterized protein n=1 Tax=Trapa incisa TaxID=236973 RepID=A0AAN7K0J7_9MYRT|nr:hypothetical protein SAY87_008685 [Trapa incisa]